MFLFLVLLLSTGVSVSSDAAPPVAFAFLVELLVTLPSVGVGWGLPREGPATEDGGITDWGSVRRRFPPLVGDGFELPLSTTGTSGRDGMLYPIRRLFGPWLNRSSSAPDSGVIRSDGAVVTVVGRRRGGGVVP